MFKSTMIALGALALYAGPAAAEIAVYSAPPYPSNPDENVLLNTDTMGTIITGLTNQTNSTVIFTGAESLLAPPQGQARIEAVDGAFNTLAITLADPLLGFTAIEFNIDAATAGDATINFFDNLGNMFGGTYALGGSGSNFFNALASGGEYITRATISSTVPLDSIGQIRLGGVVGPLSSAVPEPATWATMILGFFGLGALMRRRRLTPSALA